MFVTAMFFQDGKREVNLVYAPPSVRFNPEQDLQREGIPVTIGRWLFDKSLLTHPLWTETLVAIGGQDRSAGLSRNWLKKTIPDEEDLSHRKVTQGTLTGLCVKRIGQAGFRLPSDASGPLLGPATTITRHRPAGVRTLGLAFTRRAGTSTRHPHLSRQGPPPSRHHKRRSAR